MDGLTGAVTRIGEIQARLATLAPPQTQAGAVPFSRVLAGAVTAGSGAGQAVTAASTAGAVTPSAAWNRNAGNTGVLSVAPAGRLDAAGVPVELAAYGNGKAPASSLQTIGHEGHRLWAPAARAFTEMEAAANRDGVRLGVTDSYRSYDTQVDLARRKGLYSQGGLAARPGTSDHGWGRSLDLELDAKAQTWMRAHGSEYGYAENVPREPWHWTFSPTG